MWGLGSVRRRTPTPPSVAHVDQLEPVLRQALLEVAVAASHVQHRLGALDERVDDPPEGGVPVEPAVWQYGGGGRGDVGQTPGYSFGRGLEGADPRDTELRASRRLGRLPAPGLTPLNYRAAPRIQRGYRGVCSPRHTLPTPEAVR
jgi:hypothetical protein